MPALSLLSVLADAIAMIQVDDDVTLVTVTAVIATCQWQEVRLGLRQPSSAGPAYPAASSAGPASVWRYNPMTMGTQ